MEGLLGYCTQLQPLRREARSSVNAMIPSWTVHRAKESASSAQPYGNIAAARIVAQDFSPAVAPHHRLHSSGKTWTNTSTAKMAEMTVTSNT